MSLLVIACCVFVAGKTELYGESRSLDGVVVEPEDEPYEHHAEVKHHVAYNLGVPADSKEEYMQQLKDEWQEVDHDESDMHGIDEIAHMINEHISKTREHAYATADHAGDKNELLSKAEYERGFPYFYKNKLLPGKMMPFEQVNTDGNRYICIEELSRATFEGSKADAQTWLEKGDKDGDNHLSLAEYLKVHEEYWDKIAGGHPHLEL